MTRIETSKLSKKFNQNLWHSVKLYNHAQTQLNYSDISKTRRISNILPQKQDLLSLKYFSCILGLLKAWYDTLPLEIAQTQRLENIPFEIWLKLFINNNIIKYLETTYPNGLWKEFVTNKMNSFDESLFQKIFPDSLDIFVFYFAEGYSCGLNSLAIDYSISENNLIDSTKDDICNNCTFFLAKDCFDYSKSQKDIYEKLKERSSEEFFVAEIHLF